MIIDDCVHIKLYPLVKFWSYCGFQLFKYYKDKNFLKFVLQFSVALWRELSWHVSMLNTNIYYYFMS